LHAVLLMRGRYTKKRCTALGDDLFTKWSNWLVAEGYGAPTRAVGVDVRAMKKTLESRAEIANYMTKMAMQWSLGNELTGGAVKKGRGKGRTPTEVVQSFVAKPNNKDRELIRDWYNVSHGTKLLTWSNGLKDIFEVPDKTDTQIAEEGEGIKTETIIYEPKVRKSIHAKKLRVRCLEAQEKGGVYAVMTLLRDVDIGFGLEQREDGIWLCSDP
jgi:hypothetical protein